VFSKARFRSHWHRRFAFVLAIAGCHCAPGPLALPPPPPVPGGGSLVAFPGAEGFGAKADGGRGGKAIYVTTLAASGPGSLQAALDAPGPRTILFAVSGVIDGVPIMTHGDVTVAGQSSPGGITLRGLLIQGDVVCEGPSAPECPLPKAHPEDFIVRHLRLRPGTFGDPDGAGDGLRLHHAKNGIIDHVSIGNAEDEAFQVSFASDITIQYTLMAETIGGHAEFGGMLMNYSDPARGFPLTRLSLHHNMYNRIFGRLPEISRENVPDASVMDIELSNNVLYDVERPIYLASANPQDGAPLHYRMNFVGNYTVQDPAMAACYGLMAVEFGPDPSRPSFTDKSSLFFSDNCHNRVATAHDYELLYNSNDFCQAAKDGGLPYPQGTRPKVAKDTRQDFPAIGYTACGKPLVDAVHAKVGAFPRDPMDRRLMKHVATGTFASAAKNVNPAGDALLPAFPGKAPEPPKDSDGDGMPDAWEQKNALEPNNPADGAQTTLSQARLGVAGYTNLEIYLHQRAEEVMAQ
jgi:hypothetical protein